MALDMALAQLVASIVASAIAYALSKSGKPIWRSILGFILGCILGWIAGFALGIAFFKNDIVSVQMRAMGTTFWMAIIFSGVGVFLGRKKLKSSGSSKNVFRESTAEAGSVARGLPSTYGAFSPKKTIVADEMVYAAIAKEIESGAVDNGLWTRLYAECDGDEPKTKAAYIRHRAERLSNPAGNPTRTQPNAEQTKSDENQTPLDKKIGFVIVGAIVIGLIVVISQMGKGTPSLREVPESAVQSSYCQKHSDCPAGPPAQMCNLQAKRCYVLDRQLY